MNKKQFIQKARAMFGFEKLTDGEIFAHCRTAQSEARREGGIYYSYDDVLDEWRITREASLHFEQLSETWGRIVVEDQAVSGRFDIEGAHRRNFVDGRDDSRPIENELLAHGPNHET